MEFPRAPTADCLPPIQVKIDNHVDNSGTKEECLAVLNQESATDKERLAANTNLVKLTCKSPDNTLVFYPLKLKELINQFEKFKFDIKQKSKLENAHIADAYKKVAEQETDGQKVALAQALYCIHLAISSALGCGRSSAQFAMIYAQKDKYNIPFGNENFSDVNALELAQLAQLQGYAQVWFELESVYSKCDGKDEMRLTCHNEWDKLNKIEFSCLDAFAGLYPQETIDWIFATCYDALAALYPQETIDWISATCYEMTVANLERGHTQYGPHR